MRGFIPISLTAMTGLAVGAMNLDLGGYLFSNEFLSVLATAISGFLIAILNLLTFGAAST